MKKLEKFSNIIDFSVDSILEFNHIGLCMEIDQLCAIFASASKGALGLVLHDSSAEMMCRTSNQVSVAQRFLFPHFKNF